MIRTKRAKLKACEREMREAQSYEAWSEAARTHDDLSGMTRWKQMDQTHMYDHVAIRARLDRLRGMTTMAFCSRSTRAFTAILAEWARPRCMRERASEPSSWCRTIPTRYAMHWS